MKAMQTLEGGLRIDTEQSADWDILRCILADASSPATDLADRMGLLMNDSPGAEDWQDYVVPDLREAFQDELAHVGAVIEAAMFHAANGPGPIFITPDDVSQWYSALNQARLALEDQFHFGTAEKFNLKKASPEARNAWMRTNFYQSLQGMLLEYVMK
jgi:hypothetical protein